MVRSVEYKVREGTKTIEPSTRKWVGMQYEDKATEIIFDLSELNISNALYRIDINSSIGGYFPSENLSIEGGKIRTEIDYSVARYGGDIQITAVITELDENNAPNGIVYSFPVNAYFTAVKKDNAGEEIVVENISAIEKSVEEMRDTVIEVGIDATENARVAGEAAETAVNASEIAESSADRAHTSAENIIDVLRETAGDNLYTKVLDLNSAAPVQVWIGTKDEFALIEEPLNNVLYIFTDDISAETLNELMSLVNTLSENVINLNDKVNTLDTTVNNFTSNFVRMCGNLIYPVGSIYMSIDSTSPEILFGGKWEKIEDRFLVGAGNKYWTRLYGGQETHSHTLKNAWANVCLSRTGSGIFADYIEGPETITYDRLAANIPVVAEETTNNYPTSLGGSTDSESNLPPYFPVHMWERSELA